MHDSMSLIDLMKKDIYEFNEMVNLSHDEFKKYKELLINFKDTNSSKLCNKEKGDSLEQLVAFLIKKTAIFNVYNSVRTTSNEIDLFVELNQQGSYLQSHKLIDAFFGDKFICECKNHNIKIDVTWTGKFISLVNLCKFKFGVLFSYKGLTGSGPWNDATGLTKKYCLKEDIIIIDFNINDFNNISTSNNVLDIIKVKVDKLKHDIDLSGFLTTHPNEQSVNKL